MVHLTPYKQPSRPRPQRKRAAFLSFETVLFAFLTIMGLFILVRFVDLTPHVDQDFFFSTNDHLYQSDHAISRLFIRKDSQIIINVGGDIASPFYREKIKQFSEMLLTLDGVKSVNSITHGPKNVTEAQRSPFWSRLLIPHDQQSSNLIVLFNNTATPTIIQKTENLVRVFNTPAFQVTMSGFPYVIELIRRQLVDDLQMFSLLAFVIFGVVIILIFHSLRILLGMLITCINAGIITFMITHLLGIRVGILTANMMTIVFVLTLSHIVFLTFNWRNMHQAAGPQPRSFTAEAMRATWPASFWCMLTTFLGFASLLFVPAKPLKELGIAGSIGTGIAFIVAYSIYPAFLRIKETSLLRVDRSGKHHFSMLYSLLEKYRAVIITTLVTFMLIAIPHLRHINTDPSLISYFSPRSEITQGLTLIDQRGGSSPLVVVIKSPSGDPLSSTKAYKELMALQDDLERHPDTGAIISLPVLMAEGKRSPFFFLYGWKRFFNRLDQPQYAEIGKSFITKDRTYGLFLLRMNEMSRTKPRVDIIKEIKEIVSKHHFVPHLVGGIYALQGHLSQLVASSLVLGLGRLILIFSLLGLIIARSLRISFAVSASIAVIPICILGGYGIWRIPLDIISAPASNVAIGIGIDAMIHMIAQYRRLRKQYDQELTVWVIVRKKMWEPILTSMFIVSAGFGIFLCSSFPPTQRFGSSIALGSVVAAMTALFIFPLLASKKRLSLSVPFQKKTNRAGTRNHPTSTFEDIPNRPPHEVN